MNAIFAVAFLAACVAAQTFDYRTTTTNDLLNKYLLKSSRHHMNYDQLGDLLGTGNYFNTRIGTPWSLPRTTYNNRVDTNIYTLEEIIRHPLFQQYLTLPLFRQHVTHPLFQYYLTTPLFQQYWTIPQFQTFFQNPYLFYKYIYPVVYNTESSIFDQVKVDYSLYPTTGQDSVLDRYLNNGVWNKDVLSQYKNVDLYNRYPSTMSSIYGRHHQYPSVFTRNHLPYTYVMDKIFKSYFVNNPQITEVVTDVKVLPDNKIDQETLGKYVDPITGETKYSTEDFKVVDEKIVPELDSIFSTPNRHHYEYPVDKWNKYFEGPHMNVKDSILKRLYLNKMMYGDRKIDELFPEYTEDIKNIPILEKREKLSKLNRLENIADKYQQTYPKMTADFDEMLRTPVSTSDLLRRSFNKDLLTRVPLEKDFTLERTFGDKMMPKYEIPTEFKTFNLEKPTTKTIVV